VDAVPDPLFLRENVVALGIEPETSGYVARNCDGLVQLGIATFINKNLVALIRYVKFHETYYDIGSVERF
jgi:hypothetical protein